MRIRISVFQDGELVYDDVHFAETARDADRLLDIHNRGPNTWGYWVEEPPLGCTIPLICGALVTVLILGMCFI